MGRKKKRQKAIIFCYYCDRNFDNEKVLCQHQRAKHFKCPECHKRFNGPHGMQEHVQGVHREPITQVPNAKPGRDSFDIDIFGMGGVPPELIAEKRAKLYGEPNAKRPNLGPAAAQSGPILVPGTPSTHYKMPQVMMMPGARSFGRPGLMPVMGVPMQGHPLRMMMPRPNMMMPQPMMAGRGAPMPVGNAHATPMPGSQAAMMAARAGPPMGARGPPMGARGAPMGLRGPPMMAAPGAPVMGAPQGAPMRGPGGPTGGPMAAPPQQVPQGPKSTGAPMSTGGPPSNFKAQMQRAPPPQANGRQGGFGMAPPQQQQQGRPPNNGGPPANSNSYGRPAPVGMPGMVAPGMVAPGMAYQQPLQNKPQGVPGQPGGVAGQPPKQRKKTVILWEDQTMSQEEKKAAHPRYRQFVQNRISNLQDSIEKRLQALA